MEYIGIQERSFYRNCIAYAAHVAVFNDNGIVTCATHDALAKAMISNSKERKELASKGVNMRLIGLAHQDFSYKNIRHKLSKNEFTASPKEDFLIVGHSLRDSFPFRGEGIIGKPVDKRYVGGPYQYPTLGGIDGLL